jgi:glyoxylase-like metal-dependent hydrolase (beta-lactamase superfamily II)
VGDTLFAGSIGRMDFPTSDPQAMRHTISGVLMGLPDDLSVYPGHGPVTTIGQERKSNPFVVYGF